MINKKVDWKEFLNPEAERTLKWVLDQSKAHRGAYLNADDVKTAQLWASLIEFTKYLQNFNDRLTKIENSLNALFDAARDKEKEKLFESLESF